MYCITVSLFHCIYENIILSLAEARRPVKADTPCCVSLIYPLPCPLKKTGLSGGYTAAEETLGTTN